MRTAVAAHDADAKCMVVRANVEVKFSQSAEMMVINITNIVCDK